MIVKVIRIGVRLLLGFVFIVSALLLAWAFESRNMPALQSWHTTQLTAEFRAARPHRKLPASRLPESGTAFI